MTIDLRLPPLWSDETESRIRREAYSLDEQSKTQPKEVRFCAKCVVSNQRPRITFDGQGVCSACRYAERQRLLPDAGGICWEIRRQRLCELLDTHRRDTGYDVIVPCSGGKDSAMVAHRLKHEYWMHPLCTTWAPFAYTDIGLQNFQNFVHSGFDVITAFPNGLLHRKLARLAFEYKGDAWEPFAYGQLMYPLHMAARFGIGLVMGGENGEAIYSGDLSAADKPCYAYDDWERIYLKGSGVARLVEIGRDLGVFSDADIRDLSGFYSMPDREALANVQYHWLGYYIPWHPQSNYYYAQTHTGFEANPAGRSEGTYSKYASLDDRHDGFHFYLAHAKFGIARATSDAAHEVRDGDRTRDEAVALVQRYDGEFPGKHYDEFRAYLGIDHDQFQRVVARYRPPHLWDGDTLKHTVWYADKAADSPPGH